MEHSSPENIFITPEQKQRREWIVRTLGGATCNLYALNWNIDPDGTFKNQHGIAIFDADEPSKEKTYFLGQVLYDNTLGQVDFDPEMPVHMFTSEEWDAFVDGVAAGEFHYTKPQTAPRAA